MSTVVPKKGTTSHVDFIVGKIQKAWNIPHNDLKKLLREDLANNSVYRKGDPTAPKKPKNAWIYFTQENRPKVRSEMDKNINNGKVTLGTKTVKVKGEDVEKPETVNDLVTKKLSTMWKALSDKKKKKYTDLQEEDKQRYTEEKEVSSGESEAEETVNEPVNEPVSEADSDSDSD